MRTDASDIRASGCYCCPLDAGQSRTIIAGPFPGFVQSNRGYYSVPLSSWYLPIRSCIALGDLIIGEVPDRVAQDFVVMAEHEQVGHHSLDGVPEKQLIRLAAANAWSALLETMVGERNGLQDVRDWSRLVDQVINATELVEELHATLVAVEELRRPTLQNNPYSFPIPLDVLARSRERFVAAHSAHFGSRFRHLHERLVKIYQGAGAEPVHMVTLYALGLLDTVEGEADHRQWGARLAEQSGEQRVRAGVELLEGVVATSVADELAARSAEEWIDLFERCLPGFSDWRTRYVQVAARLRQETKRQIEWWDTEVGPHEVARHNPVVAALHLASQGKVTVAVANPEHELATPNDPHWHLWQPVDEAEREVAARKYRTARSRGRSLALLSADLNTSSSGIAFVQSSETGVSPYGYRTVVWDYPEDDSEEGYKALEKRENERRVQLAELVFYEGLRQMVATRRGITCPFRHISWGPAAFGCCGLSHWLDRLWEAGRAEGFPDMTWNHPGRCPRE